MTLLHFALHYIIWSFLTHFYIKYIISLMYWHNARFGPVALATENGGRVNVWIKLISGHLLDQISLY